MRRSRRVSGAFAIPLLVGAFGSVAFAQQPPLDRSFSPQLFHPSVGPDEFLGTEAAQPLPHLSYSLGLWTNYSRDSLTIYNVNPQTNTVGAPAAQTMRDNLSADLVFAIGLWDRLQVGIGLPMTLLQTGDDYYLTAGSAPKASGFTLGDPWIDIKVRIIGGDRGFNLAIAPFLTIPASLATANSFGGDSNVTLGGNVLAGWEGERWRAGLRVGFLYRPTESYYFSTTIGSELMYSAAVAYDVLDKHRLSVVLDVDGRTDIAFGCPAGNPTCSTGISNVDATPLEADLGVKARLVRGLFVTVAGGAGLTKGVGSPQARGILGVTYSPDARDRDHDGIPDAEDKCPDQAEDKDGFQDEDGCPDPDNDGDGIPDAKDKCPNEPEDKDGFQDEDGCPDPDNDKDGIPDIKDACPNDPEDHKPPKPNDGCPLDKTDSDDDGIPDSRDKCPTEPEDKDGFQDEDGCPDPDNDGDGIPDQYDKCPNEPEDMDGFEDDDGCPDPDNDHDGVPDKEDKCPNEPETINGYKDDDGCQDNGPPPKVQVIGEEIVILEKVFFDTDRATIKPVSYNLLDQVALTIKAHPELLKIRIEGHTDSQGSADRNRRLSQDRAESVRKYLVREGVDEKRLVAEGFGPDRPVADNKTSRGREANRRVEFHITERAKPAAPEPPQEQPQEQPAQQ